MLEAHFQALHHTHQVALIVVDDAHRAPPEVREHLDSIPNLFLVGRNGMHRYNNQDHSMLAAMTAVENIISGRTDKQNIWEINTEEEYHESK